MSLSPPTSTRAEAPARPEAAESRRGRVARTAGLWAAFLGVHVLLSWLEFAAPHTPLNDVSSVYRDWVQTGFSRGGWVGIDRVWVYPTLALAPMMLAASLGLGFWTYSISWLVLVGLLNASAVALLTRGGTSRRALGWWWLVFLLALGPIALGRLDAVTVPLALIGLVVVARRPLLGGVLLAAGVWIKVWPAAALVGVVIAVKRRMLVVVAAATTSLVIVAAALVGGGDARDIVGFVTQQTGRGLQIEAPVSTFWLWLEVLHVPGVSTYYDFAILTFQIKAPGVATAAALMNPVLAVLTAGIVVLGARALRRGATPELLLGPLVLALTTAFIAGNKVGSPQYIAWLAACVLVGFVLARTGGPSFVVPGALVLVIAVLTQVVYPWNYDALELAQAWIVLVITLRNALLVALLFVAVRGVWLAAPGGSSPRAARGLSRPGRRREDC